nr:nonstructural protein NS4B [Hepacivirus P]
SLDALAEAANQVSNWLATKAISIGVRMGGKFELQPILKPFIPHILASIQYLAGLTIMRDAPGLGSVLGFVGGALSPLPVKVNLFLTCLGGAFATRLTGQKAAAAFAVAGGLGAMVGAYSLSSFFASLFTTYTSFTSTALVVLKLLDGQMPDFQEWTTLLFNISNPGGCVAGAAFAATAAFLTKVENNVWMNRLLAMLARGTTCDEYFVSVTTVRQKLISVLEKLNIWELFTQFANWLNNPDEDFC